nr:hypothetical protein [uncultured Chitinophaga sp.]
MNTTLWGIVGTLAGTTLGFSLPLLREILSARKKIYVEMPDKIGICTMEDPSDFSHMTALFNIYIYNGSNVPKTFLIDGIKEKIQGRTIDIETVNQEKVNFKSSYVIKPFSAINLALHIRVLGTIESDDMPNMKDNSIIVTYRSGTKKYSSELRTYTFLIRMG